METSSFWKPLTEALRNDFSDLPTIEAALVIFIRMILALALGGMLGWQREHVGKAAGVRTHMFVCLGAALFVGVPQLANMTNDAVSRIIQGLTTGIGFVGAGAIVKSESSSRIQGLTTAAGIWLTAAIGVTVGLGRGSTAILTTIVALLVLWIIPGEHPHDVAPDKSSGR